MKSVRISLLEIGAILMLQSSYATLLVVKVGSSTQIPLQIYKKKCD